MNKNIVIDFKELGNGTETLEPAIIICARNALMHGWFIIYNSFPNGSLKMHRSCLA